MRFVLFAVLAVSVAVPLSAQRPRDTLRAFTTDAEFVAFYRGLREERERARRAADSAYRARAEAADRCRRQAVSVTIIARSDTGGAPSTVIGGRVIRQDSTPLRYAMTSIAALHLKTTSGKDGRFRLPIPAESLATPRQLTLQAMMLGMELAKRTLTVTRGDSVEMTVRMCEASVQLRQSVALAAAITVDGAPILERGASSDQITNVQHAGVDEGGIVKVHGDHLVILRRGRLFTVAIGGGNGRDRMAMATVGSAIYLSYK